MLQKVTPSRVDVRLLWQGLIYLWARGTVPVGAALLRHSGKRKQLFTPGEANMESSLTWWPGRAHAPLVYMSPCRYQ